MKFLEVIQTRKSIRSFADQEITDEILQKVLLAGRSAPSCQNKQCWRFIVVKTEEIKKKLSLHSGLIGTINYFIKDAPIIIIACANPKRSVKLNNQEYYLVDTAIAFQQMMLTAWNFGIGSCWLAAFNEHKVKSILSIPTEIRVVAMSPFGFPREKEKLYAKAVSKFSGSKKRLDLEKIVSYEKWKF
ncbi:MAG: nitroreductase family protein [Candidatus Cloacimonetes bacterium]|nr:nitroreductase family protein [Candidatus Cloacimonadota bacterium]